MGVVLERHLHPARICHDTWIASDEVFGDDEVSLQAPVEFGERYGVRYEELLAFIIAAL